MQTVAVGLVRDLSSKRVMRAHVNGQDLVVWRASNGDIAAWNNRCPHRGMALSHGFVRGNDLACLYHGWHYGSRGVCSYIPAHPDLQPPATIKTQVFSVVERDGVIWVNTQGTADPAPLPIPTRPLRSFIIDAAFDPGRPVAPAKLLENGVYQHGSRHVILLENPLDTARTQITALADVGSTPADCIVLSRWCEAMRRAAITARVAA